MNGHNVKQNMVFFFKKVGEDCGTDPDVVDDGLQVLVIFKHGGQAGTVATGLLFKLVVDDRPAKTREHSSASL